MKGKDSGKVVLKEEWGSSHRGEVLSAVPLRFAL